ncbi:hypothetical protein FOZ63_002082 [Perkinsus olseni]|uniref:Uncharacterized protein n=1 Tax=Perkinsus olseni TaxID=32597 RepID=A0A7J6TH14_PEROL|nr:hypothetical protein FOZ63_002082 [Perkinsus olseni]
MPLSTMGTSAAKSPLASVVDGIDSRTLKWDSGTLRSFLMAGWVPRALVSCTLTGVEEAPSQLSTRRDPSSGSRLMRTPREPQTPALGEGPEADIDDSGTMPTTHSKEESAGAPPALDIPVRRIQLALTG